MISRPLPFGYAQGSLEHTENPEIKILIQVLGSPRNYRKAAHPAAYAPGQWAALDGQNKQAISVPQELHTKSLGDPLKRTLCTSHLILWFRAPRDFFEPSEPKVTTEVVKSVLLGIMIIGVVPSVDKGLFYLVDSEFLSGLLKKHW